MCGSHRLQHPHNHLKAHHSLHVYFQSREQYTVTMRNGASSPPPAVQKSKMKHYIIAIKLSLAAALHELKLIKIVLYTLQHL